MSEGRAFEIGGALMQKDASKGSGMRMQRKSRLFVSPRAGTGTSAGI